MTGAPVLAVEGLRVALRRTGVALVSDVGFTVARGETLALLGESGCGKSLTGQAIMGLLPAELAASGTIRFQGRALPLGDARAMHGLRGSRIGMVFQNPRASLDPLMTVGAQVAEVLAFHTVTPPADRRARAKALLADVGIADAAACLTAYPHELSGGMCQRVAIAMAIACEPALLIADEATTALDPTVQRQILDLLRSLQARNGMAIVLITHDLGVVADAADRVAVLYAGEVVERAPVAEAFALPAHPYTRALLRAVPRLDVAQARFEAIPGQVPAADAMPAGCRFAPRCVLADAACAAPPPLHALAPERIARCWYAEAA